MEQPVPDAFFLPGGSAGVLLLHGLSGSAAEMRRLGGYLSESAPAPHAWSAMVPKLAATLMAETAISGWLRE